MLPAAAFLMLFASSAAASTPFKADAVGVGLNQACGVHQPSSSAYCWGGAGYGQLGNGDVEDPGPPLVPVDDKPLPVKVDTALGASAAVSGGYHSCGIFDGSPGSVFCFGWGEYGQIGNGLLESVNPSPVAIADATLDGQVTDISVALVVTCAVTSDHELFCWGDNGNRQLGLASTKTDAIYDTPQAVTDASDNPVTDAKKVVVSTGPLSLGTASICYISTSDKLFCWGNNGNGRLGLGDVVRRNNPTEITWYSLNTGGVTDVSAGSQTICAVADEKVFCSGANSRGQFGRGNTAGSQTPVAMRNSDNTADVDDVKNVIVGNTSSCILNNDGEVWCVGYNNLGQLGIGNNAEKHLINRVVGVSVDDDELEPVSQISGNEANVCAILAASSNLVCWGGNTRGGLGNDTKTASNRPVNVIGGYKVTAAVDTGLGSIESSDPGIDCSDAGGDCADYLPFNADQTFTATPAVGWSFTGWTDDCAAETSDECTLPMTDWKGYEIGAEFEISRYDLDVTVSGSGAVTGSPGSISCGLICQDEFEHGDVVTLTATADADNHFVAWSGDAPQACLDNPADPCDVTMDAAKNVTATFAPDVEQLQILRNTSSGYGYVVVGPHNVQCDTSCLLEFVNGSVVTLTAHGEPGYQFASWSGDCAGQGATCTLTMDAAKTVTFNLEPIPVAAELALNVRCRSAHDCRQMVTTLVKDRPTSADLRKVASLSRELAFNPPRSRAARTRLQRQIRQLDQKTIKSAMARSNRTSMLRNKRARKMVFAIFPQFQAYAYELERTQTRAWVRTRFVNRIRRTRGGTVRTYNLVRYLTYAYKPVKP